MAKFTYTTLAGSNFSAILTSLNNNFQAVQNAFDTSLFRDGTDPNHMTADLDMNSQRIINLVAAASDTEPVRLGDIGQYLPEFFVQNSAPATTENEGSLWIDADSTDIDVWQLVSSVWVDTGLNIKGSTGTTGLTGAAGADPGVVYNFDTSTTMADPGTGDVRFNNATLSSVTAIALSATDSESADVSDFIATWDDITNATARGYILIKELDAPSNFALYRVTGSVTDNSTWLQVTVTHVASGGSFSGDDDLSVQFAYSGADGAGSGDVSKVGTPVDNQIGVWTGDGTIEGDADLTFDTATNTLTIGATGVLAFGAVSILSDVAGTTTLGNIDALDATTEATIEAAIDTLANLVSVQGLTVTLADAGADAIFGWDDSAAEYSNLTSAEAFAVIKSDADAVYQPLDADLTSWAAITRAAGFDTFVATPSSANLASLLTDESGTSGGFVRGGGDLTWGSGSSFAWTFNAGVTAPILTFDSDLVTLSVSGFRVSGASASQDGVRQAQIDLATTAASSTWGAIQAAYSNDTNASGIRFEKSRNASIGAHTIVQVDDEIGLITGSGSDGSAFIPGATISMHVDGTPGANDMPGRIEFATTADGASSATNRWIIDSIGALKPATDATYDIGTTLLGINDIYFGSAGVIHFGNTDWVATHSTGILTVGTGDLRVTTAGTNTASVVTVGGTQTLTGKSIVATQITAGALNIGNNAATVGTVELGNTTDTTLSRSAAGIVAVEGNQLIMAGLHSIWIPSHAMVARSTNGAATGTAEATTNKNMFKTLDFDTTTQEFAQFFIRMPKSWNEGTVTFAPVWSHAAAVTNFGVAFGLAGVAISNDDTGDVAFGTAQTSVDTGGTTDDIYEGPTSSAITIAGTPQAGDYVMFQVNRTVADAGDTLAVDARLHGIILFYTIDAATDV